MHCALHEVCKYQHAATRGESVPKNLPGNSWEAPCFRLCVICSRMGHVKWPVFTRSGPGNQWTPPRAAAPQWAPKGGPTLAVARGRHQRRRDMVDRQAFFVVHGVRGGPAGEQHPARCLNSGSSLGARRRRSAQLSNMVLAKDAPWPRFAESKRNFRATLGRIVRCCSSPSTQGGRNG